MGTLKIVWRVQPKPTGPYGAFSFRNWPMAEVGGETAFRIICEDDYIPRDAKAGTHKPLRVNVAQYSTTPEQHKKHGAWRWRLLKGECATLPEAKRLAQRFLDAHPDWFKVAMTKQNEPPPGLLPNGRLNVTRRT